LCFSLGISVAEDVGLHKPYTVDGRRDISAEGIAYHLYNIDFTDFWHGRFASNVA